MEKFATPDEVLAQIRRMSVGDREYIEAELMRDAYESGRITEPPAVLDEIVRRANEAGKRLATLAVDTEVRFRSATDRAAFSNELTEAITKLVSKYHDESAPGGRAHRLVIVAHPLPQKSEPKEPS